MVSPAMPDDRHLQGRSSRNLAWLGDAEYEREVRLRLLRSDNWSGDRLDKIRSSLVRAEAQAEILAEIEDQLDEDEKAVVRRGRNAAVRSGGRFKRDTRDYRSSTAFEALIAHWCVAGPPGRSRFEAVIIPPLQKRIDDAVAGLRATLR